tara:strand:- start:276 stop:434 length:159 start_codon:yes stop_codon:yes gene_type:complete
VSSSVGLELGHDGALGHEGQLSELFSELEPKLSTVELKTHHNIIIESNIKAE